MTAVDAQFYWMSAKLPNDDFMLYAFDGEPADYPQAIEQLRRRANTCPELAMRVQDRNALSYPRWVSAEVTREQVVECDLADRSWDGVLAAVVGLTGEQVDTHRMAWRLYIFGSVLGIPGIAGPGTVAVLQISHAWADGVRASALAAWLFGRIGPLPTVLAAGIGCPPRRAVDAVRTHRQLERDIHGGLLAPGLGTRPALPSNARPEGARSMRTLVRHRSQLPGPTVTVAVLTAVSTALANLLGEVPESLGAEVPMSKPGVPQAHNHFENVTVGLYPQLGVEARAQRITADLANGRRRLQHPAARAADRAFATVPAVLLRWGVGQFNPDERPALVAGNTVVSSVHRGAADLSFGSAPAVFSAGYPALSPVMGLTHGVHGLGDTVAISVHAAASAVDDIDVYLGLLDAAL